MLLKIRCEYCDSENLEETNCSATFYCPTCDDEISIHECEIEVVKEKCLEEEELKFYYCESKDEYLIGRRVDNFYYARWSGKSFEFFMSRYLPWGEGNYPSEPIEISFTEWLIGFMKRVE